jgi:CubicO group peptidase (beta-lactamase class C family)
MVANTVVKYWGIGSKILKRGFRVIAVSTLALAASTLANTPLDGFDTFLEGAREDWGVPGVAVAVAKDDKVVFLKGYGVRRVGEPGEVNENTVFQLASVSKTFTAASLGALVDEGKLGWDDPVVSHLPSFALNDPYTTTNATVRDLLAHRTSLPAFTGDLLGELGYDREEVLARARYLTPQGTFRETANYSNVGFLTAGMVAEKVAGSAWEEVVRTKFFEPLGMTRSGFGLASLEGTNVSANHADRPGEPVRAVAPDDSDVFAPAGGVTSTAHDLAQWMKMLLAEGQFGDTQVLQAATVQEMFTPAMVAQPSFTETAPIGENTGFDYTLGWGTYYYKGHKVIEKGGALSGIRTVVVLVPEEELGVAVLANLNLTMLPEAVRAYVLEAYLGASGHDCKARSKRNTHAFFRILCAAITDDGPGRTDAPLAAYAGFLRRPLRTLQCPAKRQGARMKAGPPALRGAWHDSYDTFELKWPGGTRLPEPLTFTLDTSGQAASFQTEAYGAFARVQATTRMPVIRSKRIQK